MFGAVVMLIASSAAASDLDRCVEGVLQQPERRDGYACFRTVDDRAGARQQLESLALRWPANPQPRIALARILPFSEGQRALGLFDEVIAELERAENRLELGYALAHRSYQRFRRRDTEGALEDAKRAETLAESENDDTLLLYARLQHARVAIRRKDLGRGWALLRSIALHRSFEALSVDFRGLTLEMLGIVATNVGFDTAAMHYRRRLIDLGEEHGSGRWSALGHKGAALLVSRLVQQGELPRGEGERIARAALRAAEGELLAELSAVETLGATAAWPEARSYLERVLEEGSPSLRLRALTTLGGRLLEHEPNRYDEAEGYLREALAVAVRIDDPLRQASAITALTEARLARHPTAENLGQAERALDAIERLQELQTGRSIGAEIFDRYADTYRWLIDRRLTRGELDAAFAISERMRARQLRHQLLQMVGGSAPSADSQAILREISALQVAAIDGDRASEQEIIRLEEQLRLFETPQALRGEAASLQALRATLDDDEAMLVYSIVDRPPFDSWAFAITRHEVDAIRLQDLGELDAAVRFLQGSVAADDPEIEVGAARLGEALMGAVSFSPEIRRLILVPDGPLHGLPFDALRHGAESKPLVERFALTVVPSATILQRLRKRGEPERHALLAADPWQPRTKPAAARLALGALPHARQEAARARKLLGDDAETLFGREATEAVVKRAATGPCRTCISLRTRSST